MADRKTRPDAPLASSDESLHRRQIAERANASVSESGGRIISLDPIHATDSGTDTFVSEFEDDVPQDGFVIVRDFQSANTTTTPTLDGKTMTTRDGSALWAGAVSGVHDVQYDSGADTYLVLEPNPSQQRDLARLATASLRGDVAAFHDEDDMASDDATGVASQQSVAAFVGAQKISTGTFSGASVDISLPTGYSTHVLVITDFQPATDATNLQMRLDSVATASAYQYQTFVVDGGTPASGRAASTQANVVEDLSNAGAERAAITMEIHSARDAAERTLVYARSTFIDAAGGVVTRVHSIQRVTDEDDGVLNLFMSSGNFSQGSYTLYGMR